MTHQSNNQLYKEILDLTPRFSFWYKLDRGDQTTVLTKIFLLIQPRIQSGHIPSEPKEREGYMMITIKNEIYKMLNHNRTKKRMFEKHLVDESEYDIISEPLIGESDSRIIINQLKPISRAIYRWHLRGWTHKDISKAIGITESGVFHRMQVIKKQLNQMILEVI